MLRFALQRQVSSRCGFPKDRIPGVSPSSANGLSARWMVSKGLSSRALSYPSRVGAASRLLQHVSSVPTPTLLPVVNEHIVTRSFGSQTQPLEKNQLGKKPAEILPKEENAPPTRSFNTLAPVKKSNVLSVKHTQNEVQDDASAASNTQTKEGKVGFFQKALGTLERFLPSRKIGGPNYNRWVMVPAAVATHLCLGSVYAWSLYNDPLSLEYGVVAKAAEDWVLSSIVPVFSTTLAFQGISAALIGTWQERVGPRASGALGALCFGGGLMLGGYGIATHCLPLLYLGYGAFGGLGLGLAYVPPVATLMRWFPDKRGMATGLTIMGFGGGALVASPIKVALFERFSKAPEYLGAEHAVELITENGRRFAQVAGEMKEVVVASAADLAKASMEHLDAGVYVVGTGSTGAAGAMTVLGASYLAVSLAASLSYRSPPPGYVPKGVDPKDLGEGSTDRYVPMQRVMRSPQFWLMWTTFGTLATAGLAVVSVAKTMMSEIFGQALPLLVTGAFASTYVGALSAANLSGRVGWASASDYLGRKNVFSIFACTSIPLYLLIPQCVDAVTSTGGIVPLAIFYGSTLYIISCFGGNFSSMPAYEADYFGSKEVGAIHGRMFTACAAASVAGPVIITTQRSNAMEKAVYSLLEKVDESDFVQKFGVGKDRCAELLESKALNISSLMEITPPGTMDPTPFLYNTTMYTAAGLLSVAAVANFCVRPLPKDAFIVDKDATSSDKNQSTDNKSTSNQESEEKVPEAEVLSVGTPKEDKAKPL